ncbi:fluoride efflux transporter CrcB [Microbacterium sp. CBA3102]|uniref:fluoride efflux transporter CrcB n=1 Tax=Microbacterium sp. CBA3102 TaxID=2603598 RepID=UPI0011BB4803|nr:fluoride efflux transporter CrcB [Microbacterium sp. CBA3102]QEA29851.1 fluoride efflux transporter CrcB [Microbacterium sp. CBA3102]
MTPWLFLAIAASGGIGAALRFLIDGLIRTRTIGSYPFGTMLINVTGSFFLGLVTGLAATAALPEDLRLLVGTGLLGGYTTFSTASFETIRLAQDKRTIAAATNGIGTLVLTVGAAAVGYTLGAVL